MSDINIDKKLLKKETEFLTEAFTAVKCGLIDRLLSQADCKDGVIAGQEVNLHSLDNAIGDLFLLQAISTFFYMAQRVEGFETKINGILDVLEAVLTSQHLEFEGDGYMYISPDKAQEILGEVEDQLIRLIGPKRRFS